MADLVVAAKGANRHVLDGYELPVVCCRWPWFFSVIARPKLQNGKFSSRRSSNSIQPGRHELDTAPTASESQPELQVPHRK